jgi:hypothetical protein
MNTKGEIDSITVLTTGNIEDSQSRIGIENMFISNPLHSEAIVFAHFGTETPRCTIWDGTTPGGYNPATPSTYPILPSASPHYFELPVPSSDGTTTVENVVTECLRCTACP